MQFNSNWTPRIEISLHLAAQRLRRFRMPARALRDHYDSNAPRSWKAFELWMKFRDGPGARNRHTRYTAGQSFKVLQHDRAPQLVEAPRGTGLGCGQCLLI